MNLQQIIDILTEIIEFLEKLLNIFPVKLFAGKRIKTKIAETQVILDEKKAEQKKS